MKEPTNFHQAKRFFSIQSLFKADLKARQSRTKFANEKPEKLGHFNQLNEAVIKNSIKMFQRSEVLLLIYPLNFIA